MKNKPDKKNDNIPEDHHLTRYDHQNYKHHVKFHAWKFQRKIDNKLISKVFRDSKHGGKEGAFRAAIKYRDAFFKKHGLTLSSRVRKKEQAYLVRYDIDENRVEMQRRLWLFQIRHDGKQHTKSFQDQVYGGKEEAKKAAIIYRDKFIAKNNIDISSRYTQSDFPGVHKTYHVDRSGNKKFYYQVCWFEGKNRTKRFSVSKHGESEAIRKAIEFRKQIERQLKESGSSIFTLPSEKNVKIWRYMDFTKFIYLLEKSSLFFTHVDTLGDPFEGTYSKANLWIRKLAYAKARESRTLDDVLAMIKEAREEIFVNCWHMNDGESAAMWLLYAKTNEAICVQSDFERLASCLPSYVNIGTVKYIDYKKEWIPEDSIYHPFLYKRLSFAHEKELRAVIYSKDRRLTAPLKRVGTGIPIDINLNNLIEKIHVSPETPNWFHNLVMDVTKKYGITKPVEKSSLDAEPLK